MNTGLFREAVLEKKKQPMLHTVLLNTPYEYKLVVMGLVLFITLLTLFILFTPFAEKKTVRGFINSSKGIIRVYPTKPGVIKTQFIRQGQFVSKGEVLFWVDKHE